MNQQLLGQTINGAPGIALQQRQVQAVQAQQAQVQAQAQAQAQVQAQALQSQQAQVQAQVQAQNQGMDPNSLDARLAQENAETWIAIGSCADTIGSVEKAVEAFSTALRYTPNNPKALTKLANVYRTRDAYAEAADLYRRALSLDQNNGETWGLLGHCYLMLDDLQSAYTAYQQALLNLQNLNVPKLWHGIGILYDRYGSLEYAEEAFVRVLEMDPNFEKANEIYFRLGIIYKLQGKLQKALECFNYILSMPPAPLSQSDVWFQIGSVLEQSRDFPGAKDAYERVLQTNPNHAKVLQQLGCLYSQPEAPFHDDAVALRLLHQSIELNQADAHSWYYLGRVYMSKQDYPNAYESFQHAVNIDSRNPTFWCSIGVLYYKISQYKDALDAYTRAIRLNPYLSEVWYDLGTLYETCNNQIGDALDAYHRAASLDPSNPNIQERLLQLTKYQKEGGSLPPPPLPQAAQQPVQVMTPQQPQIQTQFQAQPQGQPVRAPQLQAPAAQQLPQNATSRVPLPIPQVPQQSSIKQPQSDGRENGQLLQPVDHGMEPPPPPPPQLQTNQKQVSASLNHSEQTGDESKSTQLQPINSENRKQNQEFHPEENGSSNTKLPPVQQLDGDSAGNSHVSLPPITSTAPTLSKEEGSSSKKHSLENPKPVEPEEIKRQKTEQSTIPSPDHANTAVVSNFNTTQESSSENKPSVQDQPAASALTPPKVTPSESEPDNNGLVHTKGETTASSQADASTSEEKVKVQIADKEEPKPTINLKPMDKEEIAEIKGESITGSDAAKAENETASNDSNADFKKDEVKNDSPVEEPVRKVDEDEDYDD